MSSRVALVLSVAATLLAVEARAGCCNVVKLDADLPTVTLKVCERSETGGCGVVLFEGNLSVGQTENVCTVEGTVLYQERAVSAGAYGPPVEALCDGADVEI
jgi:hypothetical protein